MQYTATDTANAYGIVLLAAAAFRRAAEVYVLDMNPSSQCLLSVLSYAHGAAAKALEGIEESQCHLASTPSSSFLF